MKLNALKCNAFQIGSSSKAWITREPSLSVDVQVVSGASPSTVLRYLGVNYTLSKASEITLSVIRLYEAVSSQS